MDSENKLIKEVQVRDLPALDRMDDTDVLLVEDSTSTYKVSASTLTGYIKNHPDIIGSFIRETQKGEANGVVPLNSLTKITPEFLSFGESEGTIYEGSSGRKLESSLNSHMGNTDNPHGVTKEQIGLGEVENKSSAAIRNELTYENITNALGYIPETDGSYEQSTAYTDNKIAELINGAPETLDTLKELADALADNENAVEAINGAIGRKANQAELDTHTGNSTIHTTQSDKDNLKTAFQHAQSPHARTDATKTQRSDTNGSLLINDTEVPVYQHPLSGVAAGTYRQVTVDSRGHVTSGDNTALPITQGGTGAATPEQALANLGITATADELNQLDGVTATAPEINCLKGIKSSIQTQLDNKAAASHGTHVPASDTSNQGKFLKSDGTQPVYGNLTAAEISAALGYVPGTGSNIITAVKGDAETEYQTGEYNITPAKIGLGNVDNTHDNEKAVLSASKLTNARKIGNEAFDGTKDISLTNIGAVDKSGDTMTGTLVMKNVCLNDGVHNVTVAQAFDDGDGDHHYGSELTITGNGNTFIGGGESPNILRTTLMTQKSVGEVYNAAGEQMYITSDNSIFLYSLCSTIANRKGITFDTSGNLRPLVTGQMSLGASDMHWGNAYIDTVHGELEGNAATATVATTAIEATQDSDGNVIKDTYLKYKVLTQSQYNALADVQKKNGTLYFITD